MSGAGERIPTRRGRAGFTLVELVVTMALAGLVAGVLATVVQKPMLAYEQVGRRVRLVDAAENALRHLERDVRGGLPNSLRVAGGGRILEVIPVLDGARYRAQPGVNPSAVDHTADSDWLNFTGDAQWNLLGRWQDLSFTYGNPLPGSTRLAIYSTTPGIYAEAATDAEPGSVTPAATSLTILDDGDEDQLVLSAPFAFLLASPNQRVYVIDEPITYLCDAGSQTLTRFSGYGFASAQPTNPAAAPLSSGSAALLAEGVAGCSFTYVPGGSARAGLLTADLRVAEGNEAVNLLHQVHVENSP